MMASSSAGYDRTEQPLSPGSAVYDRDQLRDTDAEPSLAIVVEYADRTAADKPLRSPDAEYVADVNQDYPPDDPVVEIAFVDALQRTVGDRWKDWDGDAIAENLRAFCNEWCIPEDEMLFSYPESRLVEKRNQEEGVR